MAELEAGPELDMAVAKAVGERVTIYFDHDLQENICLRYPFLPYETRFSPSKDLNAAFKAVKVSNGFRAWRIQCREKEKFEFEGFAIGDDGWSRFGEFKTPALAICAAILSLKAADGRPGTKPAIEGSPGDLAVCGTEEVAQ